MVMEEYASAGAGSIRFRIWEPKGEAKGVVQLVHGIAEHTARYGEFAEYLTQQGYGFLRFQGQVGSHHLSLGQHGTDTGDCT